MNEEELLSKSLSNKDTIYKGIITKNNILVKGTQFIYFEKYDYNFN